MNRPKVWPILFCFTFIIAQVTWAQTSRISLLKNQLQEAKAIDGQEKILMKICEQNYSLSADNLQEYVRQGLDIAPKNSIEHFRFKNFYCFYYLKNGKAKEAGNYSDSLLNELLKYPTYSQVRLEVIYNKSASLIRNNQYKQAIETALQLLEGAENSKDTLSVLRAYSLLGWANMELENEHEAIDWLNKGINYTHNLDLLKNANSLFLNIASCYNILDQKDSAIRAINTGLDYCTEIENLTSQANALNIRAAIYSRSDRIKEAQRDLEDALEIRKKIGDLHYIISDMGQLSHFYAYTHQPEKGIPISLQGIELAKKANNLYKLIYLKKGLAKNYEDANRSKDQINTLIEIIHLKDSLYESNSEDAIAELSTKYELQKKENIIIQQENNLIRSQYINTGALLGLILGTIILWLLYRNYKHIQQQRMTKALAEEKIHSIQAIKRAEENERKRIAADLHDNLGSYAAAITSNIRYLKESKLADNTAIISQIDENAQGIVTQLSDSIWVLKNEQLPITKLADRFKAWAQRMIQNYPEVRYFYEENILNDVELTPGKTLNIFLIIKECFNNSLKHSNCTEIKINFSSTDHLSIRIEDNGKGFQTNLQNNGNGIENIKHRARDCDLMVTWKSLQPTGTSVELSDSTTN